MRHFTIRTLMAFIVLVAVGLAALRNANDLWDGAMLFTAWAAVGVAILGAAYSRLRERAWWIGFALFTGGYLHLAAGPWTDEAFRQRFITTSLIGDLRNLMYETRIPELLREKEEIRGQLARLQSDATKYDPVVSSLRNSLRQIDDQLIKQRNASRRFDYFQSIGHSLVAVLAGLVGGMVAVGFYARRECGRSDAEAAMPRTPQHDA